MIAEDIIKLLVANLPRHTDSFSEQTAIDAITTTGSVATATVAAGHNLITDDLVTIVGATNDVAVDTLDRVETVATVVTLTDHDITLSARDIAGGVFDKITLSGFAESEFNGTFTLLSAPKRRIFTIQVADAGPVSGTGSGIAIDAAVNGYNQTVNVTVTSSTVFTYPHGGSVVLDAGGSPIFHSLWRISGAITAPRFLDESYEATPAGELWAVVVLGDVVASKQRENRADSAARFGGQSTYFRQELTQPFQIYVVQTLTDDLSGRQARDTLEQEVVPAIFKSVVGYDFDTFFTAGQSKRVTFEDHSVFAYDTAVYAHEFNFEMEVEIIAEDIVPLDQDVAFRDVELTFNFQTGTQSRTATVDLDETL